jgi:hypothetical protein
MKMMKISQSSEPLSKHDFAFQHRLWIIQHCGLAIMAAFVVAVLLGTLNLGPFGNASNTNSKLPINEDSLMRSGALNNAYHTIRSPTPNINETYKQ